MCLIGKMSFHRGSAQRGKGVGGVIGSLYKGVLPAEMMVVRRKLPPQKDFIEEEKEKTVKKVLSAVKIPKEQKTAKKEKKQKVEQPVKISKKRKVSYGDIFDAENSLSNE
jgi:hypothetical protein